MDRLVLRRLTLILSFFALVGVAQAGLLGNADDSGILPVEQAFRLQPARWDGAELVLRFDIAPGCYLYRERLSFDALEPNGAALGYAALPLGESHEDAHFGKVAVFRDSVEVRFRPAPAAAPRNIRVRYQGCAQDKVCYPSQTRVLNLPSQPSKRS